MRTGLTVSTIAHAGLIILAVVGIGMSRQLEPVPVESIAVDLVSIEEFSNIRAGRLDSTIVETQTPSVVESETPAELAQPTGNTEEDQPRPEDTPVPTPAPTTQTAPQPVPEPDPVVELTPEPVPEPAVPPAPQAEPEPVAVPEPAPEPVAPEPVLAAPTVTEEPAEVAPRPVMRTAALDQKRADFKKAQEAERKRAAEEKKKKEEEAKKAAEARKKEEEQKRIQEAKRREDAAARPADDISDIINAEQSRGATTGQGGTPTLGKPTGTAARLSQSETDGLIAQMRGCWNLLPGEIESGLSVRLLVSLNPDGSVSGNPQILAQDSSATGISIARAAVTAVRKCGPYRLAAEKYDDWRQVDVTFRASDL